MSNTFETKQTKQLPLTATNKNEIKKENIKAGHYNMDALLEESAELSKTEENVANYWNLLMNLKRNNNSRLS